MLTAMSEELHYLLRQAKGHLERLRDEGCDGLRRAAIRPSHPQTAPVAPSPGVGESAPTAPAERSQPMMRIEYDPTAEPSAEALERRKTKEAAMAAEQAKSDGCTACPLHQGRSKIVWGVGNVDTRVVFIGEGPGAEEDRQGIPFVGAAGKLLTRMIECFGWRREDVYICNTVKCRPPGNRTPQPAEMAVCGDYLEAQLRLIEPEIIVALGKPASERLMGRAVPITKMRGQVHAYRVGEREVPVLLTFHPSYLLRSPGNKRESMLDFLQLYERIGDPRRLG